MPLSIRIKLFIKKIIKSKIFKSIPVITSTAFITISAGIPPEVSASLGLTAYILLLLNREDLSRLVSSVIPNSTYQGS